MEEILSSEEKKNTGYRPLISVIMPAYNAEQTIEKAIRSVCSQTYSNLELIVINDCSSDGTAELLSTMAQQDSRIHFHTNEHNLGAAGSRNRGIGLCQGAYTAFIDSDDFWYPEKLERQLTCMEKNRASICYTAYGILDAEKNELVKVYHIPERTDYTGLLKENVIGCSTVMMDTELLKRHMFQPGFYHEDYALWLKCLKEGAVAAGIDSLLVEWRYIPDSRSGNKLRSAAKRWEVYRNSEQLSLGKSLYYFSFYFINSIRKYLRVFMK
ncbi:MAG: glycosyltransferase family A protein [Lachnospiraceae bacterium]|nr:glycosyltransferase family A protein [Lachnospiraceae bacterium]